MLFKIALSLTFGNPAFTLLKFVFVYISQSGEINEILRNRTVFEL